MKAVLLKKTGKPSVLKISEIDDPSPPRPHEVIIENKAAGINFAEVLARRGLYPDAPKRPFVLGLEGSGIVREVGSAVRSFKPGDKVVYLSGIGSYAELVKVSEKGVFPAIPDLSFEQNAAIPVSFITAHLALTDSARVKEGETLFVSAAAGSLGLAIISLANTLGLRIAGASSRPDKLQFLKEQMKIDLAINYLEENITSKLRRWTDKKGIDVAIDSVGGKTFRQSYHALGTSGRIVTVGMASVTKIRYWNPLTWIEVLLSIPMINGIKLLDKSRGVIGLNLNRVMRQRNEKAHQAWESISELFRKQQLEPVVDSVFEFKDVQRAHERIESRESIGKIILKITE